MSRCLTALIVLVTLAGCGPTGAPSPNTEPGEGRGLFWSWSADQLANEGYPGSPVERYSSPEWGLLYDDEGVPYGPKSYYSGRERLDHPRLEVTEEYLQSSWVRVPRSACCTEPLLGHYLEICDLAWMDLTRELEYTPSARITVFSPADLDEYLSVTGTDFAQSFVVADKALVVQPIDVLFRRTLAGHVAYAGLGEVMIRSLTHGTAPPWLQTGVASYLAQEGFEHLSFVGEFRPQRASVLLTPAQVAADLVPFTSREAGRIARYNAFLMAWHLSENHGFDRVVALLHALGDGQLFADAVQTVYGVDEASLLAAIDPTVLGEPTTTMPAR